MNRLALPCLVVLVTLVACNDSPTGPSTFTDPGSPSRPVESRFDDAFWRQLVFDQFDNPNTIASTRTRVNATSLNVYIRMGDPTGRRVVSFDQRDDMRRAIPRLAEQLTGQPYRGVIEDGIGDRTRAGWITVRFVTVEEEPEISEGACGRAGVGMDPGSIWIIRRARGNKNCVDDAVLPGVFAHEFGHALGFFHVANRSALMEATGSAGRSTFTDREQYHVSRAEQK